jgi:hypothetical protein
MNTFKYIPVHSNTFQYIEIYYRYIEIYHKYTISTIALYKAIYITQTLTKAFIKKHFIQNIMRLQTYCYQKHEAADLLMFNKAPNTHTDSSRTK